MSPTKIDWECVKQLRAQIFEQAQVVQDCKRMMRTAQDNMAKADTKMRVYKETLHNTLFPEGCP